MRTGLKLQVRLPKWLLKRTSSTGFTLLELLTVVVIIGILVTFIAAGWLGFMESQYLSTSQNDLYQMVRDAQSYARRQNVGLRVSFRSPTGIVQWAVHPKDFLPSDSEWNSLNSNVQLDESETTLLKLKGIYRVEFSHKGNVVGQLGRITLMGKNGSKKRRCVIVSTLLGAVRKGEDHSKKLNGRICY